MHELIQSEIQSDIISEKSLLLPAEVFRFRSVPFREIYPTASKHITFDVRVLYNGKIMSLLKPYIMYV